MHTDLYFANGAPRIRARYSPLIYFTLNVPYYARRIKYYCSLPLSACVQKIYYIIFYDRTDLFSYFATDHSGDYYRIYIYASRAHQ